MATDWTDPVVISTIGVGVLTAAATVWGAWWAVMREKRKKSGKKPPTVAAGIVQKAGWALVSRSLRPFHEHAATFGRWVESPIRICWKCQSTKAADRLQPWSDCSSAAANAPVVTGPIGSLCRDPNASLVNGRYRAAQPSPIASRRYALTASCPRGSRVGSLIKIEDTKAIATPNIM